MCLCVMRCDQKKKIVCEKKNKQNKRQEEEEELIGETDDDIENDKAEIEELQHVNLLEKVFNPNNNEEIKDNDFQSDEDEEYIPDQNDLEQEQRDIQVWCFVYCDVCVWVCVCVCVCVFRRICEALVFFLYPCMGVYIPT